LARAPTRLSPDALLRVVARVQADLAADLRLDALAAEARLSPAHFQRAFTRTAGVSPAAYVARVRLERAAFALRVQRTTALGVALSVGFSNADTFTRAFRRRFGTTPSAYRRSGAARARLAPVRRDATPGAQGFSLSPTRVVRLRGLRVAFVRHVGPYEDVDAAAWTRLVRWARERGVTTGWCVGIGHDAPGVTAPADLRFDAGIVVGGPVRPGDGVGVQDLPGGWFASTTHVGPYATFPRAYPQIFERAKSVRGHELVGLPVVEVYHDATIDPARPLSVTDVLLPVRRT
jgi:AraC family transcriptional regulator